MVCNKHKADRHLAAVYANWNTDMGKACKIWAYCKDICHEILKRRELFYLVKSWCHKRHRRACEKVEFFESYFVLFNNLCPDFCCLYVISVPIACHPCKCSKHYPSFAFAFKISAPNFREIFIKASFDLLCCAVSHAAIPCKIGGCFAHGQKVIRRKAILLRERKGYCFDFCSLAFDAAYSIFNLVFYLFIDAFAKCFLDYTNLETANIFIQKIRVSWDRRV